MPPAGTRYTNRQLRPGAANSGPDYPLGRAMASGTKLTVVAGTLFEVAGRHTATGPGFEFLQLCSHVYGRQMRQSRGAPRLSFPSAWEP